MKKKILAAVMAAVMGSSLAACGGGSSSGTTAAPAATTAAAETKAAEEGKGEAAPAAESWKPTSAVSIIVPAGAGGDTDLTARLFAQYAKELTGVDFVVVNANGASGSVAANQVLSAAPDGHTFLYGHNLVNVANVAGITDYNYSAFKLGPTFVKEPAQQLYVNAEKYADLNAFIEAAKAAPGQLKACTEVGAYTYYEILLFQQVAGIELDLVDVGSNADKITAMLSKQVDLMPGSFINTRDYIEAGQFRCLGVPGDEVPDYMVDAGVKTFKEQGVDLDYPSLDFSFYFPKDTPDEVIAWYESITEQICGNEQALQSMKDMQVEPYYLSAADSEKNDEAYYNIFKTVGDSVNK